MWRILPNTRKKKKTTGRLLSGTEAANISRHMAQYTTEAKKGIVSHTRSAKHKLLIRGTVARDSNVLVRPGVSFFEDMNFQKMLSVILIASLVAQWQCFCLPRGFDSRLPPERESSEKLHSSRSHCCGDLEQVAAEEGANIWTLNWSQGFWRHLYFQTTSCMPRLSRWSFNKFFKIT